MFTNGLVLYSPNTVPGAVSSLQAVNVSDNELKISWEAPESGAPVESYKVTVRTSEQVVSDDSTDDLFILISELGKSLMMGIAPLISIY